MASYQGNVTGADSPAVHYVRLRANEQYIIDAEGYGRRPLYDPALTLVGENGEYAEDDDGGSGRKAQIVITPQKTQFFDVTVLGEQGSTGGYRLEINIDDFRNGIRQEAPAGALTTDGRGRKGVIDYSDDADIFAVSLLAGLTYGLRAAPARAGGDKVNPDITLLDASGRSLAQDADSGPGKAAFLSIRAQETGDAWLRVEASGDGTGEYWLRAGVGRGDQGRDLIDGSDKGDWANVLGGDDIVRSGLGADRIWGASGDDMLDGGEGSDTLFGGSGRDGLYGGLGGDALFGEAGRDALHGGEGSDRMDGGDGADALFGEVGGDWLTGGLGNDRLDGGDGGDQLYGGDGNDIGFGRLGRDTISGDAGDDRLHGGDSGDDLYGGEGNDRVFGGRGNDYIDEQSGDNVLRGGDGGDNIYGGDGVDDIAGGLSDDYLYGSDGDDFIRGGQDDDSVQGGDGDDRLYGNVGGDYVDGEDGDDVIFGGRDGDRLYGGGGMDVFVFFSRADTAIDNPDAIGDFERPGRGEGDLIDLSAIDADRRTVDDDAFRLDASGGRGTIWLEDSSAKRNAVTLVYINLNGDAEAEALIRIEDGRNVTAADYSASDFVL